jgi:head-tail adaptor
MTTIQFDLFGEDEETTELNTILIETAEQLEAFWASVCGKSEEQIAYENAKQAWDDYYPIWAKAQNDYYQKDAISKAEFLAAKAIFVKLDADLDSAYYA